MTAKKVALVMGDPAGVSPELFASVIAASRSMRAGALVAIGDKRLIERGARDIGAKLDIATVESVPALSDGDVVLLDRRNWPHGEALMGRTTAEGGQASLDNFKLALQLGASGEIDAICFTPFNKQANSLAHAGYEDEISFSQEFLKDDSACMEINIVDKVWNGRVTSHVPLKEVAALLTYDTILGRLRQLDAALKAAGRGTGRIAVAALNPHAGDGGKFGREEIDIIGPVVEAAISEGIDATGPLPSDTVFVRAQRGDFEAVLTMYHDQGQIAMKLMGFDRGYTALFGLRVPITTASHGTAYDIAGKGIANSGPMLRALQFAFECADRGHRRR